MRSANLRWLFERQPESAHPVIVLQDDDDTVALFEPGGARIKHTLRSKRGPRDRNLVPGTPHAGYEELEWTGDGVLRVHRPGQPWSTWRWLGSDGTWSHHWYVNLEEPWQRTPLGFDTEDWILDVVVAEDLSWRFKDEDEFNWAVDSGRFTPAQAERVRASGQAAVATIEQRLWPFDADWDAWLPPAAPMPVLLDGWDAERPTLGA